MGKDITISYNYLITFDELIEYIKTREDLSNEDFSTPNSVRVDFRSESRDSGLGRVRVGIDVSWSRNGQEPKT